MMGLDFFPQNTALGPIELGGIWTLAGLETLSLLYFTYFTLLYFT